MTRDGWNLSYFSARLQQQPDSFELTGKGYWMHSFEALHFSTQVRYLRCSTGSSLYGGKVKATKKAKHKVKATIKAKCNIMSTAKTAAPLFATNSSASSAYHRTSRRVANPTYQRSGFGIQHYHRCY